MVLLTSMTSFPERRESLYAFVVSILFLTFVHSLDVFGRVALNMDFACLEGGSKTLRENWRNFGNEIIKPDGFKVIYSLSQYRPGVHARIYFRWSLNYAPSHGSPTCRFLQSKLRVISRLLSNHWLLRSSRPLSVMQILRRSRARISCRFSVGTL